jgi:hypothetical protein
MFSAPLYEHYTGTAGSYKSSYDTRAHERSFEQVAYQAQHGGCYICYYLRRPVKKTISEMVSKMPLYKSRNMGEARVDFEVNYRPEEQFSSLRFTVKWGALATGSASFLLIPVDTLPGGRALAGIEL